jgi:hypothetical protein
MTGAAMADDADILCANAPTGKVPEMPAEFTKWVVVLCTPTGMALAPKVTNSVVLWTRHSGGQTWWLYAWPEDLGAGPIPNRFTKYDIRFTGFGGGERTGTERKQALEIWQKGFGKPAPTEIGRVYQLDVRTVWNMQEFTLFFYTVADKPKWIISCLARCVYGQAIDVVEP